MFPGQPTRGQLSEADNLHDGLAEILWSQTLPFQSVSTPFFLCKTDTSYGPGF